MTRMFYDSFDRYLDSQSQADKEREERMLELRRKASANLTAIYANRGKLKPEKATKDRRTELQRATAHEIQLGYDVLERRELNKHLYRLLRRRQMTEEEHGAAEEYQSMIDAIDDRLRSYTRSELSRFVRLWNKSQKVRYKS